MPVHLLPYLVSSGSSISLIHPNAVLLVSSILVLIILRRWSNGVDLLARLHIRQQELDERAKKAEKLARGKKGKGGQDEVGIPSKGGAAERDLHGTTWLVSASLMGSPASPSSLLVLAGLASRGAQLVVLLPSTHFETLVDEDEKEVRLPRPAALQLLQLLRDGANNELIFAEECDLRDVGCVDRFVTKWAEGEGGSSDVGGLGAGPAGGRAASGLLNPGAAGGGALGGGDGQDVPAPGGKTARRCDGLVLLPYSLQGEHGGSYESLKREHAGRFHLVNSLLASLLVLPPQRDIRIVMWVSPWYAAGVRRFEEEERRRETSTAGDSSADGISTSVNGSKAQAKKRKSKATPVDPAPVATASSNSSHPLSVTTSGSLTLSSLLTYLELQRRLILLAEADPRPRNPLPGILDDKDHKRSQSRHWPNVSLIPICPGFERVGEVWSWAWLGSSSSSTALPLKLASAVRKAAVLLCWPLALVFAKSPKAAADEILWGCVAPLDAEGGGRSILALTGVEQGVAGLEVLPEEGDAEGSWRGIQPGRLYRQGKIVRLPDAALADGKVGSRLSAEALAKRWERWEGEVKEMQAGEA
ncbi:hypothetical protein BDZ90DRAFT_234753 [Jaminaea rosea]|uniref:Uncharacterized protein n=1 Tax=Jaminaea rosea TaxID=1569628 RepID=A0A316UIR5_9BASI|nr:hypothetical protein BDZ90DRAFT_234753 [Jaminaea rosea]PWN24804.1 hypothetical protein BDZ90DRAFT_234753 [Jaminaea rosea]